MRVHARSKVRVRGDLRMNRRPVDALARAAEVDVNDVGVGRRPAGRAGRRTGGRRAGGRVHAGVGIGRPVDAGAAACVMGGRTLGERATGRAERQRDNDRSAGRPGRAGLQKGHDDGGSAGAKAVELQDILLSLPNAAWRTGANMRPAQNKIKLERLTARPVLQRTKPQTSRRSGRQPPLPRRFPSRWANALPFPPRWASFRTRSARLDASTERWDRQRRHRGFGDNFSRPNPSDDESRPARLPMPARRH